MKKEDIIRGEFTYSYKNSEANALLVQPVGKQELAALDKEVEAIKTLTNTPFSLLAFAVYDWNDSLSPWEAPAVFGNEGFGSGAERTLKFLTGSLLSGLGEEGKTKYFLGGYSLAGLFALWSAYRTDKFDGVAAVSPSVWFPGWKEFAETHEIFAPQVYLSLGDKEEKTRNKTMSAVGDNIRHQYALLQKTDAVKRCLLEWNPGNHFAEPLLRTAKGFAWLLDSEGE